MSYKISITKKPNFLENWDIIKKEDWLKLIELDNTLIYNKEKYKEAKTPNTWEIIKIELGFWEVSYWFNNWKESVSFYYNKWEIDFNWYLIENKEVENKAIEIAEKLWAKVIWEQWEFYEKNNSIITEKINKINKKTIAIIMIIIIIIIIII